MATSHVSTSFEGIVIEKQTDGLSDSLYVGGKKVSLRFSTGRFIKGYALHIEDGTEWPSAISPASLAEFLKTNQDLIPYSWRIRDGRPTVISVWGAAASSEMTLLCWDIGGWDLYSVKISKK